MDDLSSLDAFKVGLAQCAALIPGTSRSGATIIGGMLFGLPRAVATEFSFFLAIPAVLGSGLYQLYQTLNDPSTEVFTMPQTLIATVVAFVVGYAVIAWLMKFISKASYLPFVIYRSILGLALLVAIGTNLIG